jgi:DNA-binding LacI/PurR family transcriptional regulator
MAASLAAKGIRNIIVWGFDKRFDLATFERLRILGINMVFFDRVVPGPYADHVGLDNADAAKTLLQAASADGLKEALVVTFSDLEVDSNRERQEAFLEQCAKLGVPCEILAIPYAEDASGSSAALAKIPQKGEGLGAFFINDQLALKLKPQLPAGARLYSVDGTPKALAAGIASYSQPMRAMAAACVEALRTQQRLGQKWQARRLKFKG